MSHMPTLKPQHLTPCVRVTGQLPTVFLDRLTKSGGCWEWGGARCGKGYGSLSVDGHVASAHRRAWELAYGPIPKGMQVCHTCDNPPCCNPAHLFLGTNRINQLDSMLKGRRSHLASKLPYRHCERCGRLYRVANTTRPRRFCSRTCTYLLTPQQRESIQTALARGQTQASLAREYGVSGASVWMIKRGHK
jgi:predicted nucleic acid-binding Zn ribbon protein